MAHPQVALGSKASKKPTRTSQPSTESGCPTLPVRRLSPAFWDMCSGPSLVLIEGAVALWAGRTQRFSGQGDQARLQWPRQGSEGFFSH